MTINYNVNPYYDDFDEEKQYYRILFRPGRAVQARELTQIQTSLQKQIERFGRGIYKDGSIVVPGALYVDRRVPYANLTSAYSTNVSDTLVSSLLNSKITGQASGVSAVVVNYETSTTSGDPTTIYLQYTSANSYANGVNTVFQAGELITNSVGNISLRIANTTPTGLATSFAVSSGVLFTKGAFAYYDDQKLIVDKYAQANNLILGFDVTESTVTSASDTSLLDPAVGASNYIAPGADRYKIALDLAKRPLTFDATLDPNFIEMARLEDGEIISKNLDPQFSILGDTLARRTFDESGNYSVKPYGLSIINHLRTSNNTVDGYLLASDGGDDDLLMNIIAPGKSYVRGYEIENVRSRYLLGSKARDFANVNNGIVSTPIGNYIFIQNINSIPDLSILPTVTFYDDYNVTPGTANGNPIGTAKIRGIEFSSGTIGTPSGTYKVWLFDVNMTAGYVFERDVKQLFVDNAGYEDFTADIVPVTTMLTGSVTITNGSNSIVGVATSFNTELTNGDYITVGSETFRVGNVVNSTSITANSNATTNATGVFAFLNTTEYNDTENLIHVFEFPYSTIKTVDPTNLETSYDVRRSYSRTLSSNAVTISAGTDESFDGISTTNYILSIKSGTYEGQQLNPSSFITRASGGTSITIDLASLADNPTNVSAYATASIAVAARLTKTNTAADKKIKTLVANTTVDYVNANTAQATTISLGKADIYRLVSVKMSNAAFGSAYTSAGETDITSRYNLDNGQKSTYYGVGSINLKANSQKPTGPIRITFDYFTHGTGDYFSVDSYSGISYGDIPSFTHGNKTYKLRDCLDFRPRINDAGTGFSGTGAVVNDFLDPTTDVLTDYSYYLPRIDKITIDRTGTFVYTEGVSSLAPKEPKTPSDSMALFVLKQNPYVFDINEDIEVTEIDNKRYTMRDIGRIENRVKNLEYYTALNLLERETESLQIQDSAGFDRFKNGFIVDNFTGHGIGDVFNRDYGAAVDYNNQELRPLCKTLNTDLYEINVDDSARIANNYVSSNNIITLPFTHVEYAKNDKASTTENINPFSVITWLGKVTLDPASDIWFDETRLPTISRNEAGNYDQFLAEARAKGTYGTVWGNWTSVYYGNTRVDTREGTEYTVVERIDTRTDKDVVVSREVIPKMRSVSINFTGEGLKPKTKLRVFFDNINVTDYCAQANNYLTSSSNTSQAWLDIFNRVRANNIITDAEGRVSGTFTYVANALNLDIGQKAFRLTDSPTNGSDFETLAEAIFTSSGELVNVRDEIVSVRNAQLDTRTVVDSQSVDVSPPPPPPSPAPEPPAPTPVPEQVDFIDFVYNVAFGRDAEQEGRTHWTTIGNQIVQRQGFNSLNDAIAAMSVSSTNEIRPDGGINSVGPITGRMNGTGANAATKAVFDVVHTITKNAQNDDVGTGRTDPALAKNPGLMGSGAYWPSDHRDFSSRAINTAQAATYALAAVNSGLTEALDTPWADKALEAVTTPILAENPNATGYGSVICIRPGQPDPLAQTFFVDTPLYLTKVDIFFSSKDEEIPMRIQIRKVVNGFPGPFVVPMSERYVYPSDIQTSDDGSIATPINFEAPIYLDAGEYAVVLLADSLNYRVWISQINQTDLLTDALISEQPYIGVLFKSQNASTWTADQYQDLKFTLYRASFDTGVTGVVEFQPFSDDYDTIALVENPLERVYPELADPLEVYPNSNIMRIIHPNHGMNTGASISITGFPNTNVSAGLDPNTSGDFFGINLSTLEPASNAFVKYTINNVTLDSYTITLPQNVNGVSQITRTGGLTVAVASDFRYDSYYPVISAIQLPGTSLTHRIKGVEAVTYTVDSAFTTISVDTTEFDDSKVLPSNVNRQVSMSNATPFIHRTEISTTNEFLSPVIDTKKVAGVFARNIINNPTYDNSNFVAANDIVTIANANNIVVTQISGPQGLITFSNTQDKINATSIVKGTYLNITANNGVNNGQYRVLDVTDNGTNVSIYNVSTQNVSTNATATYTITNGRNFIAEEAAFDGSAYSKYITRELPLANPCTAFKFYLDVMKPTGGNLKFYYKISEVGDTTDLVQKEYTEITNVTIPTSLDGRFNEVEKIVENLPQYDAIVFKIVFLGDDSSKAPKCKNFRLIALA